MCPGALAAGRPHRVARPGSVHCRHPAGRAAGRRVLGAQLDCWSQRERGPAWGCGMGQKDAGVPTDRCSSWGKERSGAGGPGSLEDAPRHAGGTGVIAASLWVVVVGAEERQSGHSRVSDQEGRRGQGVAGMDACLGWP